MFVGEAHSVDRSSGKIARAKASVTFTGKKKWEPKRGKLTPDDCY